MTQVSEADFFAFQWEHHIWSTFKKSYITPPACAAFAVEQTNELLLHFTSAVRTDSLAGSHKSLLELGNNFIGGHTAGKQLFQYGFCFSLFGFFCGLFSAATFFASALESSFAATFKADFLLFNCSFSVLMLSDSAAISVSICSLAAVFSATIAASLWCYRHHQAHRLKGKPKGRHEQIGILERGKTESWSWLQALKWWNGKHKGI